MKLKNIVNPIGNIDQLLALKTVVFMFNIITTKRNKTAIAPTYTIKNKNAKNSAPKSKRRPATLQNTKIKKSTECTAFDNPITIIAETRAKLEKR
jgi:uncharacterized protein YpbB